jgi:hypothetical protein
MSRLSVALAGAVLLVATPAIAGPPYDTDDPVPTDFRHWEIYSFLAASGFRGQTEGSTGLDLNFGAMPGVQLTATLPMNFAQDPATRIGAGNIELGVKYRFFHSDSAGLSLAAFPRLILPSASHGFGSGRTAVQLPVWAQKDFGGWSLFGGGGYTINPGAGNRNFWKGGIALTREVTRRLSLGAEATFQGPDARDARSSATLGLGGSYRLKHPLSLLFSAGPGFERGSDRTQFHAYAALLLNF